MSLPVFTSGSDTALTVAPYVIIYLIPAVIAAELALYGWHWRHLDAAMPFSLLMTAVVFWSACHAASIASSTLEAIRFWAQIQYGGIVLVAPIWLLFALAYHRSLWHITTTQRCCLLLPAVLSYAAVLTNEWHHLWWPTVAVDTARPFGSLSISHGPLFWLHFGYSYGCVLLGCGLVVHRMLVVPPFLRRQAQLVVIGALFPIAGNLAHILGLRTTVVDDPTPFLFAASGLLIVHAGLHYQFPDVAPLAPRALLASLPDGFVVLDRCGLITTINEAVPRLLALARQGRKWMGRSLQSIIAGSPLEADLRALLISPDTAATRTTSYRQEQEMRAVELRLRPLYDGDVRAGSLIVLRDRTETVQKEQVPEQLKFLAAVTHELRTPLTSIIGFTDLLGRGMYGELPERVHEALASMHRNGQMLLRLINDILDFSRMEAGRFTVALAPVDLAAVIRDVVGAMQPQIQERGLSLEVELAAEAPPVYGNRERLEQVLTNLLANAIKFTDQGTITVRTAYVGERVRFSVTDTGIGIAPEQQRLVFQEFHQIESAHQGRYPGTGLGLTISRLLMELMGGTLSVESTLGVGSTFSGEVPVAPETLQEKEYGATPSS